MVKISVIIPVGDRARYGEAKASLERSIARARECVGEVEWELVEVDDSARRGVSWARNEGLRRAKGEYLAWMDADDEVEDAWATEIARALKGTPDVVTLDAKLVGWKRRGDLVWGEESPTLEKLKVAVYRDDVRWGALWLYVTRRELWEGIWFDEGVKVAEDYLVMPRVLERARSCGYIAQKLYRYICNEGSLINTVARQEIQDWMLPWERRMAEAPEKYKRICRWERAASCYWLCDWAAVRGDEAGAPPRQLAEDCRGIIRREFWWLLGEAMLARDLRGLDRMKWGARFACAMCGIWWLQRWRARKCERG